MIYQYKIKKRVSDADIFAVRQLATGNWQLATGNWQLAEGIDGERSAGRKAGEGR